MHDDKHRCWPAGRTAAPPATGRPGVIQPLSEVFLYASAEALPEAPQRMLEPPRGGKRHV